MCEINEIRDLIFSGLSVSIQWVQWGQNYIHSIFQYVKYIHDANMDRNYPTAHAAINIYFGLKVSLKSDGPGVPYFKCMNDIDIYSWCTCIFKK